MALTTVRALFTFAHHFLTRFHIPHPEREAGILLSILLNCSWPDLYLEGKRVVEGEKVETFRRWVKRRARGEPVAYITEHVHFMDCLLTVDARVLIPRQETELLVDLALKEDCSGVIWDLCTGCGAIALGVKKHRPEAVVIGSDLSEAALTLARKNAEFNDLDLSFRLGDLLAPFRGEKANVIFCNPPYVSEEEFVFLEREVSAFEPKLALVAEKGGLLFFERLREELPQFLAPGGRVYLEIGSTQRRAVTQLFDQKCWTKKECQKDWAGLDRFFLLEFLR